MNKYDKFQSLVRSLHIWPIALLVVCFPGAAARLDVQNDGSASINAPLIPESTNRSSFQVKISPRPSPMNPISTVLTTDTGEQIEGSSDCDYGWGCLVSFPSGHLYVNALLTWSSSSIEAGTHYEWSLLGSFGSASGTMISNTYYCGLMVADSTTVPDLRPGNSADFRVATTTLDSTTGTPNLTITSGDMHEGNIVVGGGDPGSTVTIRPSISGIEVQNDHWTYLMSEDSIPLTVSAGSSMSPREWSTSLTITMECL